MTGRSSCPECGTILRIRDRSFVGRRVNCPDCKTVLRIETANEDGSYAIKRLVDVVSGQSVQASPDNAGKSAQPALTAGVYVVFRRWINSPLTAAWLLAIAVMALIGVLTLSPKVRYATSPTATPPAETVPSTESPMASELAKIENSKPTTDLQETSSVKLNTVVVASISALEPANMNGPLLWPPVIETPKIEPEIAEPPRPPKIDVKSKMEFRFPLYKQSKPVARRDLLESLREQLDAPIYYDVDDLGVAGLNSTITFELQNPTLGDVIKTVADGANWELTIEDTGLRITKKQPADR